MKKRIAPIVLLFICLFANLRAQDFMGFSMSNYSGITGACLNPASLADNRMKVDVELIGLDLNFNNNYIDVSKQALSKPSEFLLPNFAQGGLLEPNNNQSKYINLSASVHLPSFMVTINPKNSIGFTCRIRTYVGLSGLEPNLAHQLYKGLQDSVQYFQDLENKNLSIQFMSWAEYGLTFAHVFMNKDKNFLKAGVTVKLLQGLGAAYMVINDLHYRVSNKDTIAFFNTSVDYAHSTNFDFNKNAYNFGSNFSVGGDLGIIYEYRPDYAKYKYDMDGKTNMDMRWKSKYKFKFGISVLDIGGIKYAKGDGSGDFSANVNLWDIAKTNIKSTAQLDSTIKAQFGVSHGSNTFYMNLPTTVNLQADYGIWRSFYAGLMGIYAFQFAGTPNQIHELSKIAFVARWDPSWVGVYVPVSYDALGNTNVGLNLRLGSLIIGSNTLNADFGKGYSDRAEFHVMLKVLIPYHEVRDRDKDKVSDKKDKCPDVAGVWEFMGCPDRDGDHVPDNEDQCPDQPGPKELHGCPDKDGDGIIDKLDACPDEAGPLEFNGCPDRDGDKIPDKDDACPDEPGLPQFKGCPDRDGDGVIDKLDKCPDKKGPADNDGCPVVTLTVLDASGNVLKKVRQSPNGTFEFDVLPDEKNAIFSIDGEDTDNLHELNLVVKGVTTKITRGADNYFHLQVIKTDEHLLSEMDAVDVPIKLSVEEAKVLKKAFSNLEFESGKEIILSESFASLNELAAMLKKKPEWKLKLSGYTDNLGSKEKNMKLSETRARAVSHYLIMRGIDESRFKILWFGPGNPIAPNTTPEGRQKNRRVEMLIID